MIILSACIIGIILPLLILLFRVIDGFNQIKDKFKFDLLDSLGLNFDSFYTFSISLSSIVLLATCIINMFFWIPYWAELNSFLLIPCMIQFTISFPLLQNLIASRKTYNQYQPATSESFRFYISLGWLITTTVYYLNIIFSLTPAFIFAIVPLFLVTGINNTTVVDLLKRTKQFKREMLYRELMK